MANSPYIQTTSDPEDTKAKLNLMFNPFTAITRSKIYVPQSVMDWGKSTFGDNAEDKTALLWHSGILLSTGAASVALLRMLQAASDSRVLQKQNPEDKPAQNVSTARKALIQNTPLMQKAQMQSKQASEQHKQEQYELVKNLAAWVPGAALIAGALIGYNVTDQVADKAYGKKLKKRIADTDDKINNLVIARAQLARQNIDTPEVEYSKQLVKTAGDDKPGYTDLAKDIYETSRDLLGKLPELPGAIKNMWHSTQASLALLAAGALALGVGGGYAWSAKRNKARLQHKAAKKAINQYIRAKVQEQTIDSAPIGLDVVERIQGNKPGVPNKRQQPQLPPGLLGAPVSVDI